MFMKQLYVIFISLFAVVANVFAADKDKLYTQDNKVYTGYISTQIPGKQVIFISDGQVIPFDNSDLLMIRYEEHDPELLTGLNDVIKTKDGKVYSGQITEQVFGKSIKIKTSDGEETIDASIIQEQQKVKMSKDYTLMEQAPYKTLIKTYKEEEYVGVVVFQYYGDEENPSYLEISSEDNANQRVYISDISQMRRIPNNEYREVEANSFDIEDGKVYFNKVETAPVYLSKQRKGKRVTYYVNENIVADHAIIVDSGKGELVVEMKEDTKYSNYKLIRTEIMKIGKKYLYGFVENQADQYVVNPNSSKVDSKDVMSKVYNVETGMYLFYKQGSDEVFFVEIVKQEI